jgi:hypothetical protein
MASTLLQQGQEVLTALRHRLWRVTVLVCLFSHLFTIVGGTLSAMVPMNGPLSGGTSFTLSGGTFNVLCTTKTLNFNAVAAAITVSTTTITGFVPSYVSGLSTPMTLSYAGNTGGSCATSQSFSSAILFSYDVPVFDGVLYGSKNTIGGGSITITGNNFLPSSVNIAIGSTSSTCSAVLSFVSFKCAIPAFSLGARIGLDIIISMNSVLTPLIKFAYDAPVLSYILPQVPKLDGMSTITFFGANLEAAAPAAIKIGASVCSKAQMITAHQVFLCVPGKSDELVRTNQSVQVSLFSGVNIATSWLFEPSDTFLHLAPSGALTISTALLISQFVNIFFADFRYPYSTVVVGTGMSIATAGQLSSFAVLLLDTFSVDYPQRSGCNKFIAISCNFGSGDQVFAKSDAQLCQNGTYRVSYIVTRAGIFTLSLLLMQGLWLYLSFLTITFLIHHQMTTRFSL